eukprot:10109600-Ditylum_brightwellii.AAC.1
MKEKDASPLVTHEHPDENFVVDSRSGNGAGMALTNYGSALPVTVIPTLLLSSSSSSPKAVIGGNSTGGENTGQVESHGVRNSLIEDPTSKNLTGGKKFDKVESDGGGKSLDDDSFLNQFLDDPWPTDCFWRLQRTLRV